MRELSISQVLDATSQGRMEAGEISLVVVLSQEKWHHFEWWLKEGRHGFWWQQAVRTKRSEQLPGQRSRKDKQGIPSLPHGHMETQGCS
jgi:hypothetical protein